MAIAKPICDVSEGVGLASYCFASAVVFSRDRSKAVQLDPAPMEQSRFRGSRNPAEMFLATVAGSSSCRTP